MTGNAATDGCFSVGLYSFTPGVHSNKDRYPLRHIIPGSIFRKKIWKSI